MSVPHLDSASGDLEGWQHPRRRRWPRWLKLLLGIAALVVVAASVALYVSRYAPLRTYVGDGVVWPTSLTGAALNTSGMPPVAADHLFRTPRPGFQFGAATRISASGPFPITIINVSAPLYVAPATPGGRYVIAPPGVAVPHAVVVTNSPLDVSGNSHLVIRPITPFAPDGPAAGVEYTIPTCRSGSVVGRPATLVYPRYLLVTYKFFFFTRTQQVPLVQVPGLLNPRECQGVTP